jgi:hypothetical protein
METTKYCSKCDTTKPIEQFSRSKRSADGYSYTCKSCIKEYQLANKEKLKEYQRNYQPQYKAEHKTELNEYLKKYQRGPGRERHLAYVKQWRAANPDKVAQYKKVMAERKQKANDQ